MSGASAAKRAIAYIRQADAEPVEAGRSRATSSIESPIVQRQAIESWALRERVEIAAWHVDLGVTAATPIAERPGLVSAYRDLHALGAGVLVAANAERFAHDELVCWLIERAALTQGAVIHTADGSRGPTPSRMTEEDEADVAYTRGTLDLARAYQRVMFRARVRAALAANKAQGRRAGNIPYGYRLAEDGVHVEPDAAEGAVISIVRRLAGEGLSQRKIASQLEAQGVTGRTGAPLRQTQIANILRSAP